jgi:hypothetical protein
MWASRRPPAGNPGSGSLEGSSYRCHRLRLRGRSHQSRQPGRTRPHRRRRPLGMGWCHTTSAGRLRLHRGIPSRSSRQSSLGQRSSRCCRPVPRGTESSHTRSADTIRSRRAFLGSRRPRHNSRTRTGRPGRRYRRRDRPETGSSTANNPRWRRSDWRHRGHRSRKAGRNRRRRRHLRYRKGSSRKPSVGNPLLRRDKLLGKPPRSSPA